MMTTPASALDLQEEAAVNHNDSAMRLLVAVASRKRWMLLGGLCLALLVFLLQLLLPKDYTAATLIMPPSLGRNSPSLLSTPTNGADVAALIGGGGGLQMKPQTDMFVSLLAVRPIADTIIKRFDLIHVFHARDENEAAKILAQSTAIEANKQGFIQVSVTTSDATLSARLANAYPEALRDFMTGLSLTEASSRRHFYEGQLAKSKSDLSNAELNFKQMQQSSHMIALDSQAKAMLGEAATLSAQIRAKEVDLEQLRSYSTDANAQVQILETQISALRGQLQQVESRSDSNSYSDTALSSVPGAEIDYVRAERELKFQEGLYEVMVKQYEGSLLDEAKEAPSAQVLEPALVPERASGPHVLRNTLYGFVAGVFFSLIAILAGYVRDSMSPESRTSVSALRKTVFTW